MHRLFFSDLSTFTAIVILAEFVSFYDRLF